MQIENLNSLFKLKILDAKSNLIKKFRPRFVHSCIQNKLTEINKTFSDSEKKSKFTFLI